MKKNDDVRHYPRGYRPPSSYVAKTPEAKARQQTGLFGKRGRKKGSRNLSTIQKEQEDALQNADIIEFAESPEYLNLTLYPSQRAILRALYGLPVGKCLKAFKSSLFHEYERVKSEACWVLGARSGKSFLASIIALYEATRSKWREYLRPDEIGYIVIIATRQQQAQQIIQKNAADMICNSKISGLLRGEPLATEIEFKNGIKIIGMPCNSTSARGLPIITLIMDEVGHFFTEGTRADIDIFNSLRPRMAQFPGAKTLLISTPSAKQGLLWDYFKDGFEVPGRLTVQASTHIMNPTIPESFIERERLRDPDNYNREFMAQFAEKVSSYFPADKFSDAFVLAKDVPPLPNIRYCAGIDQSGLSAKGDRFGFSIAHIGSNNIVTVDAVRSWQTEDLDLIMSEIQTLSESYNLNRVFVDRYAGNWIKSALLKIGLVSEVRDSLPAVYSNFKRLLIAGKLELPDNKELRSGLQNTTAYYGKNNSLSIAHERTREGHGDLADATVTAVAATRIPREPKPQAKIRYSLQGGISVESNKTRPFNWPHLVEEK